MKNLFVGGLIFWTLLTGCSNRDGNTMTQGIVEQKKAESLALIDTFPKFNPTTNSNEIKQTCESIIFKIDSALPKLRTVEKTMTLYNVPRTPVIIWYSDSNLPVKIEHAVADDSGEFTGKFEYYFIDGKFWYSNQIFARYIFEDGHLTHWLDEYWGISEIPGNDFSERGVFLTTHAENLLTGNQ